MVFHTIHRAAPLDSQGSAAWAAVGTRVTSRPPHSGRAEARTGLRMMPTFPRSPLIPYGGFSPIRLEGWHVGQRLSCSAGLSLLPAAANGQSPAPQSVRGLGVNRQAVGPGGAGKAWHNHFLVLTHLATATTATEDTVTGSCVFYFFVHRLWRAQLPSSA